MSAVHSRVNSAGPLPRLPEPFRSQKFIVQLLRPAALKVRRENAPWVLDPKSVIAGYVEALSSSPASYRQTSYVHDFDGSLRQVYRASVLVDFDQQIEGKGDSEDLDQAEKIAALHAMLQLVEKGLITEDGRPTSLDVEEGYQDSIVVKEESIAQSGLEDASTSSHYQQRSQEQVYSGNSTPYPPASLPPSQTANGSHNGQQEQRPFQDHLSYAGVYISPAPVASTSKDPYQIALANRFAAMQNASAQSRQLQQQQQSAPVPAHPQVAPLNDNIVPGTDSTINIEVARELMDFYIRRYGFAKPDLSYSQVGYGARAKWEATLRVNGKSIGCGDGPSKKDATQNSYIDACIWLSKCDPALWQDYREEVLKSRSRIPPMSEKTKTLLGMGARSDHVPSLEFSFSNELDNRIRDVIWDVRKSELYEKALGTLKKEKIALDDHLRSISARTAGGSEADNSVGKPAQDADEPYSFSREEDRRSKSMELQDRLRDYQQSSRYDSMRETRASLPVAKSAEDLLRMIDENPVVIVMAATGSGKTTQIPQLILDEAISQGSGAMCNVVCTQPRRLAAISVAQRVASERGERVGDSIGYQVRFESRTPQPDGSILFCTTGIFLRRLQNVLEADVKSGSTNDGQGKGSKFLDEISHVVVDEVHERDIDVDLLLFVLRRHMEERRKAGKKCFKVILMSATIDPTLFCRYFASPTSSLPAPVIEVPGRSFPVTRHYLDEIVGQLNSPAAYAYTRGTWVFDEKDVKAYLQRELHGPPDPKILEKTEDSLKLPTALIALTIAYVVRLSEQSDLGHILVFLPGLDEIKAVQRALLDMSKSLLEVDFHNYDIHILHSAVPVADQQAVFAPSSPGVQRIILSTNIAETSVTIPDVVYVVDAGKCKEKRFDPQRHLSSLVSAFTGTSNMSQRAGRAGRHRPGEYFSLVSERRLAHLPVNQTVEMKRLDLSNVVMHVKGLGLPMEVAEVLDACIEPPEHRRVVAAIQSLHMVGALDVAQNLTSLGRVLLQLPVEAAIGKLCLLGCVFRCLDQALTLAAIMTNRDPFVAPLERRSEANAAKARFSPKGFKSDVLAALKAYNEWSTIDNRYDRDDFCDRNFLSRPTLMLMQQVRDHILGSLDRAGVIRMCAGGREILSIGRNRAGRPVIPETLNMHGDSLPLLTALIAATVSPNFAIKKSARLLRTPQDTAACIHTTSLLAAHKKVAEGEDAAPPNRKQIYAYVEATRNASVGDSHNANASSQLRGITLLDPLGLFLFGVNKLGNTRDGFKCDDWLPISVVSGDVDLLDDLERFKGVIRLCLIRVFEGVGVAMSRKNQEEERYPSSRNWGNDGTPQDSDAEEEHEGDDDTTPAHDPKLSENEIRNLDQLSQKVVQILNDHAVENGLPARDPDMARQTSSRDRAVYENVSVPSYPSSGMRNEYRSQYRSEERPVQTSMREPVTAGWSEIAEKEATATSLVPSSVQDASYSRRNGSNRDSESQQESQPSEQVKQEQANGASDGWDSYKPKETTNDAYERRRQMSEAPKNSYLSQTPTPAVQQNRTHATQSPDLSTWQSSGVAAGWEPVGPGPGSTPDNGWGRRAQVVQERQQAQQPTQSRAFSSQSYQPPPEEASARDSQTCRAQASSGDAWGNWQPSASGANDAYEKRRAMSSSGRSEIGRASSGYPAASPARSSYRTTAPVVTSPSATSTNAMTVNGGRMRSWGNPTATQGSLPHESKSKASGDDWESYNPSNSSNDAYERRKALSSGRNPPPTQASSFSGPSQSNDSNASRYPAPQTTSNGRDPYSSQASNGWESTGQAGGTSANNLDGWGEPTSNKNANGAKAQLHAESHSANRYASRSGTLPPIADEESSSHYSRSGHNASRQGRYDDGQPTRQSNGYRSMESRAYSTRTSPAPSDYGRQSDTHRNGDDAWSSYQPTATQAGEDAYRRRAALSNQRPSSDVSVSSPSASRLPPSRPSGPVSIKGSGQLKTQEQARMPPSSLSKMDLAVQKATAMLKPGQEIIKIEILPDGKIGIRVGPRQPASSTASLPPPTQSEARCDMNDHGKTRGTKTNGNISYDTTAYTPRGEDRHSRPATTQSAAFAKDNSTDQPEQPFFSPVSTPANHADNAEPVRSAASIPAQSDDPDAGWRTDDPAPDLSGWQ